MIRRLFFGVLCIPVLSLLFKKSYKPGMNVKLINHVNKQLVGGIYEFIGPLKIPATIVNYDDPSEQLYVIRSNELDLMLLVTVDEIVAV